MITRDVELTSEWQGKNINMDATAKPGEIQDSEDKFRTIEDENYTWDIDPTQQQNNNEPEPEPTEPDDEGDDNG